MQLLSAKFSRIYGHDRFTACIAFIILAIFHIFPEASNIQAINGLILDSAGYPVSKAEICIYKADYHCQSDTKCVFPTGAFQCTYSSKSGKYRFKQIPSGAFVIIGKKGEYWFYRNTFPTESLFDSTIRDTLCKPGSLRFMVHQEGVTNQQNITVHLPGTPFSSNAITGGQIELKELPVGTYQALIRSKIRGYNSVQCSLRIRTATNDIFGDTLRLSYVTPFEIENFKHALDSSSVIHLSWEYSGPEKTVYTIFRKIDDEQFYPIANRSDRSFTDTLLNSVKKPVNISYYVDCNSVCYPTDTISILISQPEKAKAKNTQKRDSLKKPQKTSEDKTFKIQLKADKTVVSPLQKIHLRGAPDPVTTNLSLEWSINGAPFKRTNTADTVLLAPITGKIFTCILRGTGVDGSTSSDTLTIKVQSSSLQVFASGDTTAGVFEKVTISAQTEGINPIVSLGWDIGNTGNFVSAPNGRLSIGPLRFPQKNVSCIVRAIDESGETAFDTLSLNVGYQWEKILPVPELSERKSHVLVTLNDAIWSIGGSRSDVWNSDDGKRWNLINDTAPFGPRYGHASIAFDGKLWVIGGKVGLDSLPGDVWNSNDGIQWRKIAQLPFLQRYYHSTIVFQNQIFIIGGINDSANNTCLNDIWFSKDGIQWSQKSSNAGFGPRYGHGTVVFNNSIFLIGGNYEDFYDSKTLHDVWTSPNGYTWNKISESLESPDDYFLSCLVYDKRIWAIGGFSKNNRSAFSNIWSSIDGVTWSKGPNEVLKSEGFHLTGAVFNNQILMSPSGSKYLFALK